MNDPWSRGHGRSCDRSLIDSVRNVVEMSRKVQTEDELID